VGKERGRGKEKGIGELVGGIGEAHSCPKRQEWVHPIKEVCHGSKS